jgi:hypothetical protein
MSSWLRDFTFTVPLKREMNVKHWAFVDILQVELGLVVEQGTVVR